MPTPEEINEQPQEEHRRPCTDCISHLLMEERVANLVQECSLIKKCMVQLKDKVNEGGKKTSGIYVAGLVAALFVGLIVTIVFSTISDHKAEAAGDYKEHKEVIEARTNNILATMRSQNAIITDQVKEISRSVNEINQTVAVMARTYEMSVAEVAHEIEGTKKRLHDLERIQSEKERRIGILESKRPD